MSHPTPSPGTVVPGAARPAPAAPSASPAPAAVTAPDVSRQIADLTEAVNRLVQAQQQRTPSGNSPGASPDIGGDLPGGEPLAAAIDHAKLSPLQQIALGLRGVTPVGLTHPAVERSRAAAAAPRGEAADERAPAGAD